MKIIHAYLKPDWTFKTERKVWRLLPGSGVLITELRDPEAKTSEYTGIDIGTGKPLWKDFTLEDSWWVVINRIFRDVLLLQQFVRPDMPTPGKIFAVDLHTGKLLWQNPDVSYLNASGDLIYGMRKSIQSSEVIGFDFRTGIEKLTIPADDPRVDELSFQQQQDEFTLSSFFEEIEDTLPKERTSSLLRSLPTNAQNPTFIPSIRGKDIIGFYTDAGKDEKSVPVFDSHLRVMDSNRKTVFDDVVDRKVYTTLGDFYFVVDSKLIYARNSDEIVAIDLKS